MSIPPLVCSTPPPPDQCEDEKISDDFDIGYNQSQCRDDEQENYRSSPLEEKRIDEDNIEDLDLQLEDITSVNAKESSKEFDENTLDDEFGDFDDFQFTSGNVINNDLLSESNPWTNNDAEDITFKANFDEMQIPSVSNQSSPSNVQPKLEPCENDDKFDDFDDFKSSEIDNENRIEIKYETDAQKSCSLSPLDIHLSHSDVQITETVDKVLSSVFQEEIATDDAQPERTLLSFLCETWGHLTEAEVRQPYIVNWNNSLNQKTLLKALCIDSRNIQIWVHRPYSLKKSNATFPSTNDSCSTSALNTDNWSEPINIEGKEFTYAEALLLDLEHLMATLDQMAHNHSALKISELLSSEVFEEIRKRNQQCRIILHHGSVRCHTSAEITPLVEGQKIELTGHPPYSPGLAPNVFYLFPRVKNKLRGQRFSSHKEAIDAFKMHVLETSHQNGKSSIKISFGICKSESIIMANILKSNKSILK
ncbi:hypothetical protein EVAR_9447_1 [Eumeta japonica]|uniref:Mariner Mos1 transposase n=1 Tax=Eumeta variegata TaxID=151549 RepID=A0A4C1UDC3_EUMVA|nr:hypothetical protein EVAR_9447_1 [Eumeta japonica]